MGRPRRTSDLSGVRQRTLPGDGPPPVHPPVGRVAPVLHCDVVVLVVGRPVRRHGVPRLGGHRRRRELPVPGPYDATDRPRLWRVAARRDGGPLLLGRPVRSNRPAAAGGPVLRGAQGLADERLGPWRTGSHKSGARRPPRRTRTFATGVDGRGWASVGERAPTRPRDPPTAFTELNGGSRSPIGSSWVRCRCARPSWRRAGFDDVGDAAGGFAPLAATTCGRRRGDARSAGPHRRP